eukprot:TRINITY_DN833_c0_g1_i10.p1 TRINITY_DN833_c0_g1~~TRINITY_DN833_c0_g1_i10.p1  ORF type:complete len:599 (-),score=110.13 TRINITY_DN833_c0_g1_i10:2247-4043(-)
MVFSENLLRLLLFVLSLVKTEGCWGSGFVRAQSGKLVDSQCQEYIMNGFNSFEMIESAAGLVGPRSGDWGQYGDKGPLLWMLDTALETNLCSIRMFGHGHHYDVLQLQSSPGYYNEDAFRGLDIVLDEAAKRNIKLVISFADNWKEVDGKRKYVEWSSSAWHPDDFYFDGECKQLFKNHINHMVSRVNAINGRTYKDDPTIIAWNLMNEPRCECDVTQQQGYSCTPECGYALQSWIEEMSAFIKSVDPNHMITIGQEGFYGPGSGKEWVNPDKYQGKSDYEAWAVKSGQNFVNNHSPDAIDFTAIHIWVDNWELGDYAVDYFNMWIEEHMHDSRAMGKPLVLEEYGKKVWYDDHTSDIRDPYFYAAYDRILASMEGEDILQGGLWWEWQYDEKIHTEEYDVKTYQTTWQNVIQPKSYDIKQLVYSKPRVPNCIPGGEYSYEGVVVDFGGNWVSYYISRGKNLLSSDEGETIVVKGQEYISGVSPYQCAASCQRTSECTTFSYNPNQEDGTCYLKRSSGGDVYFNFDGWQTYWRKSGSRGCNKGVNCRVCSEEGVCIACKPGYLLQSDENSQAYCKSCNDFSQAIKSSRLECHQSADQE